MRPSVRSSRPTPPSLKRAILCDDFARRRALRDGGFRTAHWPLGNELTVRLAEVRPGLGAIDYRVLLTEMDRLDPDTPILVEHLRSAGEDAAAIAHIRTVAAQLGLGT